MSRELSSSEKRVAALFVESQKRRMTGAISPEEWMMQTTDYTTREQHLAASQVVETCSVDLEFTLLPEHRPELADDTADDADATS